MFVMQFRILPNAKRMLEWLILQVPIVENFDVYKITVSDSMRHMLASYLNYTVKEHLTFLY